MFLRVPNYSTFKSSFTLGLLPAYAVLIASAFALLPQSAGTRALISGYVFAWLGFGYAAYFVW